MRAACYEGSSLLGLFVTKAICYLGNLLIG